MFGRKDFRLKTNAKGFIILGIIIASLVVIYFFSNFNRFTVAELYSESNNYSIKNGIMVKSPNLNIIKIDEINYKNSDLNIKNISLELIYKGKNTTTLEKIEYISPGGPSSLINYLKTVRFNVKNKINLEMVNKKNNLFLKIHTIDENNQINIEELPLINNKLSSKRLLYF